MYKKARIQVAFSLWQKRNLVFLLLLLELHPLFLINSPLQRIFFRSVSYTHLATNVDSLASIFMNTTIAPATATVVCMLFTWIKDGKPDVGMCLNASLAGLVGITAGCRCV